MKNRYSLRQMRSMFHSSGKISDRRDLGVDAFQVVDDENGNVIFDLVFVRHGRVEELSLSNTPGNRTRVTLAIIENWATKLAART